MLNDEKQRDRNVMAESEDYTKNWVLRACKSDDMFSSDETKEDVLDTTKCVDLHLLHFI